MKIVIDGGALCAGEHAQFGTHRYTSELLKALKSYSSPKNTVIVYHFCDKDHAQYAADHITIKRVTPSVAWMKLRVPIELMFDRPDVFIASNQALPWLYAGKKIVISHGLSFMFYPDAYREDCPRLKSQLREYMSRSTCVIVSSERVAGELRVFFPDAKPVIAAIPFGMPELMNISDTLHQKSDGIPKNYLLYVGSGQAIKNIPRLLQIYAQFRKTNSEIEFILVGPKRDSLPSSLPPGVVWRESASKSELAQLYQQATAYLSVSQYESFNFPVLEALSYGCPVIALDTAVIPEMKPFVTTCKDNAGVVSALEAVVAGKLVQIDRPLLDATFSWKRYVMELEKYIM